MDAAIENYAPPLQDDDVVSLNVGGRVFTTTFETLRKDGAENYFTTLLCTNQTVRSDRSGIPFIDRSSEYFAFILDYLRGGPTAPPEGMNKHRLHREFDFYGIQWNPEELPSTEDVCDRTLLTVVRQARERLFFPQMQAVSASVRNSFLNQAKSGSTQIQCTFIPTVDLVFSNAHTMLGVSLRDEQVKAVKEQWQQISSAAGVVCDDQLYQMARDSRKQLAAFMKQHNSLSVEVKEDMPQLTMLIDGNVFMWKYSTEEHPALQTRNAICLFNGTITVKWTSPTPL